MEGTFDGTLFRAQTHVYGFSLDAQFVSFLRFVEEVRYIPWLHSFL